MIILRSEYKISKEDIDELEGKLSIKLKDDVVIIPKGLTILAEIKTNSRVEIAKRINDKINKNA